MARKWLPGGRCLGVRWPLVQWELEPHAELRAKRGEDLVGAHVGAAGILRLMPSDEDGNPAGAPPFAPPAFSRGRVAATVSPARSPRPCASCSSATRARRATG